MRVTERAQKVVTRASWKARRLGRDRVATEHLLLALLGDEECLAVAALGELGLPSETLRRHLSEGPGQDPGGTNQERRIAAASLPMAKSTMKAVTLAYHEAKQLEHDRIGTEHLLLGLASEGEALAARVLRELGGGPLELRAAVAALYATGIEPEPYPPDRGPPPWEPPLGARLRRVIPVEQEHPLPSGDQVTLISLEVWSDWFELRYAIVFATPEPSGDLPRPHVLGQCQVSDAAGTEYRSHTGHTTHGAVRVQGYTFVPAPPEGTQRLEVRFMPPSVPIGSAPPLVVATVELGQPAPSG